MNTGTAGPKPKERTVKLTMAIARKDAIEGESLVPLSDVVVSLDADVALVRKSGLGDTIVVIMELSVNVERMTRRGESDSSSNEQEESGVHDVSGS